MKRLYDEVITRHFSEDRQMAFLMGPRQAGKTTTARSALSEADGDAYLNWDNLPHRKVVLAGPDAVAEHLGLDRLRDAPVLCVLDEIHKHRGWKTFLKGFFDTWGDRVRILVTGSARLDVYRAGGDSLMGRYFAYRMHPLSLGELGRPALLEEPIDREPRRPERESLASLLRFGGFPEPFLRQDVRFWNRWRRLRNQQLFREDLRDLTRIQEIGQVEALAEHLRQAIGSLTSHASLASGVAASVDTVRRWVRSLESLYHVFAVRPWTRNVTRSLRKEPKYYLWDWSLVEDPGARAENLVASALLKSVHHWTDTGFGDFALHFLRDKEKREVDFVVSKDGAAWFLVEVKLSGRAPLSPHLARFQAMTGAPHAFQVALDLPFVERDAFSEHRLTIVPAETFLAQLV